jgi:hypothetical protein
MLEEVMGTFYFDSDKTNQAFIGRIENTADSIHIRF